MLRLNLDVLLCLTFLRSYQFIVANGVGYPIDLRFTYNPFSAECIKQTIHCP